MPTEPTQDQKTKSLKQIHKDLFPHSKARAFALSSVIALGAIGTVALPHLDADAPSLEAYEGCTMEGHLSPKEDPERNHLKNRYILASGATLDGNADLDSLRDPKQQAKFHEERSAEITGFVVDVKMGGPDSSNCNSNDPKNLDTEIFVGPEKTSPKKDCVVVHITPRVRTQMALTNHDWSTETLRNSIWGKKIEVTGWLFYDADYETVSAVSKKKNLHPKKPWRATCWEIHPVTDLTVLPDPG